MTPSRMSRGYALGRSGVTTCCSTRRMPLDCSVTLGRTSRSDHVEQEPVERHGGLPHMVESTMHEGMRPREHDDAELEVGEHAPPANGLGVRGETGLLHPPSD